MFVALIYISAITLANLSVAHFGPSITPVNAFLFIGLDLTLRNYLAVKLGQIEMFALIGVASGVSYLLNPATGVIALASVAAFASASIIDWTTFKSIKGTWFGRCMGGVTAGALVDSLVFPTIAFGSLMPTIVLAQFAAKVVGGAVWAFAIDRLVMRRPLASDSFGA
jgi:queuosine precursor transporter